MVESKNVRALALIVCTLTYLVLGATVFDALESETDMRRRAELAHLKRTMQQKYRFTEQDYAVLETLVIRSIPHQAGLQWRFPGAFYFATLVITTVGYGHSTPATTAGKAFCIVYALAGIPLGLVMFQSIGERLNALIAALLAPCLRPPRPPPSPTQLALVSGCLGGAVIALGTYVFSSAESWAFFDAYYYCIITLTTIGFGDFVPLQKAEKLNSEPAYVVFTLVFILFGLAVFSASVNLFVLRFMTHAVDSEAAEAQPQKRVLLREFSPLPSGASTPRGGLANSCGLSANDVRKASVLPAPSRRGMSSRGSLLVSGFTGQPSSLICGPNCQRRLVGERERDRPPLNYRVRRGPGPVSHLLNSNNRLHPPLAGGPNHLLVQSDDERRTSL